MCVFFSPHVRFAVSARIRKKMATGNPPFFHICGAAQLGARHARSGFRFDVHRQSSGFLQSDPASPLRRSAPLVHCPLFNVARPPPLPLAAQSYANLRTPRRSIATPLEKVECELPWNECDALAATKS